MEMSTVLDVVAAATVVFLLVGAAVFVLWFFARLDKERD